MIFPECSLRTIKNKVAEFTAHVLSQFDTQLVLDACMVFLAFSPTGENERSEHRTVQNDTCLILNYRSRYIDLPSELLR